MACYTLLVGLELKLLPSAYVEVPSYYFPEAIGYLKSTNCLTQFDLQIFSLILSNKSNNKKYREFDNIEIILKIKEYKVILVLLMYCELTNSHCTFIHLVPCFHLHAFLLIPSFSASLPSATKGL